MSLTTRWALGGSAVPSPWRRATANQKQIKRRVCSRKNCRLYFHLICFLATVRILFSDLWINIYSVWINCWTSCRDIICSASFITVSNVLSYIKTLHPSPVCRGSPVKPCLCDISLPKHNITAKIIHPLDMSHTKTKLYLLLNHISDGAALLENCMLCVWFMSRHIWRKKRERASEHPPSPRP